MPRKKSEKQTHFLIVGIIAVVAVFFLILNFVGIRTTGEAFSYTTTETINLATEYSFEVARSSSSYTCSTVCSLSGKSCKSAVKLSEVNTGDPFFTKTGCSNWGRDILCLCKG